MPNCAPVVLFIYNRPEHTERTLRALAANELARDSDLIVYADGAKKSEHHASVAAARGVARRASGFRSVRMIERDRNLGLANSIITGVTEICHSHGRAIVVEDDLVVAPGFLEFLNKGLDRYASEERVMQVSGYTFPGVCAGTDARFLSLTTTWGWGIWRRAWNVLDRDLLGLDALRKDANLRHRFDLGGAYDYFDMACRQKRGQVDSWGIAWYLSVFLRNGLVLYPSRSLVLNTGIDGSGTHGPGQSTLQQALTEPDNAASFRFPDRIEPDMECLAAIASLLRSVRPGFVARTKGLAKRVGKWLSQ
jgi:hypothetical protein